MFTAVGSLLETTPASLTIAITIATLRAISGHVALLLADEAETLFEDSFFFFVSAAIEAASEVTSGSAVVSEATSITSGFESAASWWAAIESSRRAIVSEAAITVWRHVVPWWEVSVATATAIEVTVIPHSARWAKAVGSWHWAIVDLFSQVPVAEVSASSVEFSGLTTVSTESWAVFSWAVLSWWSSVFSGS